MYIIKWTMLEKLDNVKKKSKNVVKILLIQCEIMQFLILFFFFQNCLRKFASYVVIFGRYFPAYVRRNAACIWSMKSYTINKTCYNAFSNLSLFYVCVCMCLSYNFISKCTRCVNKCKRRRSFKSTSNENSIKRWTS